MTTNNAVLYMRVSSDEQRKTGYSLDYQRKRGEEYAAQKGLNIVKQYSESFTGKRPGRPLFNAMIEFCKKHNVRNLIFLVHHRASRNGVDSAQLVYMAENMNYNIHLIEDGLILNKQSKPTDYLIFEVSNCMANFYPRNLSVEVRSKLREKAEQGYYPERPPIGYERKPKLKRAYLQINPEKAPFIKRIFELYSTRQYSYSSLAKQLREEGFYISPAVKVGKSNIEDILNNPIYIGDFVFKGKRYYNAKHEPIISRELYALCQEIIKEKTSTKANKREFLFSNMIRCKKCGCFLVGEIKKEKYIYYHCTGNRGGDCKKKYIREESIEKAVLQILKSFEVRPELLDVVLNCLKTEIKEQNFYNENRIKTINNRIETLKNRLDKLLNLYLDGQIEKNIFDKKKIEFETELDGLLLEQNTMQRTGFEILNHAELLFELFKNAATLYISGDIQLKREILGIVCSNFYFDGENIEIAIKKAIQPLLKIAFLENLGVKRRNSNFLSGLISEIKSLLNLPETVQFLERFLILKNSAEFV